MSGAHALQEGTRVTLLRGADLVASPWKNGGGVTREIAAEAAGADVGVGADTGLDAFAWRVSVADVAQAGQFSRFDGVDRTLVLLEGAGMLLDESGPSAHTHALTQPLDLACFAGETPIEARLVGGPTRDFNLMVRRGVARGTLDVWPAAKAQRFAAQTVLLYCARGDVQVRVDGAKSATLAAGDTLRVDAAQAVDIETQGEGAVLAIALDTQRSPS
jgi:uncharacterized protein